MQASSATSAAPPTAARGRPLDLLVFNLGMDADHMALAHTIEWTNELSRRASHVSVITMLAGDAPVRDNVTVHSLGKELGRSEPARLVEFYRAVNRVLAEHDVDACFAHNQPLFSTLMAPVARARGIPVLLWFAHSHVSRRLRVAHALADRCVTSTPAAFRVPSDKLHVIGQGIDTTRFKPPARSDEVRDRTIVSIGRLTEIKRVREMIEALALVRDRHGIEPRFEIFGGALTDIDHAYEESLHRRVAQLDLDHLVTFHGPVPFLRVPEEYRRGAVFLNLTPSSLDKAILEAMASGCVPVSDNPGFRAIAAEHGLEALIPGGSGDALADTLATVLEMAPAERTELATRGRRIVVEEHSLARLADVITGHLTELAAQRSPRRRR